ncbi:MAG TPA: radical SAM protein [Gammaproteobacteria bacterium]
MKIVLTHGYFIYEDPAEAAVMKPYPPLGLLYISAYLKRLRFDVEVLDTTFLTRDEFLRRLEDSSPAIVGIYGTLMTRRNVLWMTSVARKLGARIVLGGPEPINYADEYLDHGADVIVAGEGEQTLAELIPQLLGAGQGDLAGVAGIAFREESGGTRRTAARPQLRELDELPLPDRAAIDLGRYQAAWRSRHGISSVSLITARGCPYTCRWCSHSVYGFTHRRRSPENVADELEMLNDRYRPDQVWYADDVFTINKRWLYRYAEELERRGIRLPFETITREDRLDERVAETLAAMGCYRIWIGAESGSQRILDAMDRRTDAERMREMIRLLARHGIRAGTFIMVGYEGETWQDIDETARHLTDSRPDDLLTTLAYPIKGTAYYDDVAHRVVAAQNWAESSDRDLTVAGRYSRQFYAHAQRWLKSELDAAHLRSADRRDYVALTKQYLRSKKHRAAMYLTRHQRERA